MTTQTETLQRLERLPDSLGCSDERLSEDCVKTDASRSPVFHQSLRPEGPVSSQSSQCLQSSQSGRALKLIEHHANLQGVPVEMAVGWFNDFDLAQVETGELSSHAVAHVIRRSRVS